MRRLLIALLLASCTPSHQQVREVIQTHEFESATRFVKGRSVPQ